MSLTAYCMACQKWHTPEGMVKSLTGKKKYCRGCVEKIAQRKRQPGRAKASAKGVAQHYQMGGMPWGGHVE